MGENAENRLEFLLQYPAIHVQQLGHIRQWFNLKMSTHGQDIWIKGFTEEQIHSNEVLSLPHKTLFEQKQGQLYPLGSYLPQMRLPSGLLWSPISKALPVKIEKYNHNFFGLQQQVKLALQESTEEQESYALRVGVDKAASFIETASAMRLAGLKWLVINDREVLILGTPLLPIAGTTYWRSGNFLLPSGFSLNHSSLSSVLEKKLNPEADSWILCESPFTYGLLKKTWFKPLGIASFRKTLQKMEA